MVPDTVATLSGLLAARAQLTPDTLAYRQWETAGWRDYTWGEIHREVGRWQAAFLASGLKTGDRVAVCMRNRVEWVLFDQAALGLGLITVPLYFNDRAENMVWSLNDAGVRLLLLEDGMTVWPALQREAPNVERVVCLHRCPMEDARSMTLAQWLAQPAIAPRDEARSEALATIVYTSGTTGRPKGVMLTHHNIVSNVFGAVHAVPVVLPTDRFLSILPLSHMFERTVGYYFPIVTGTEVVYARGVSELAEDLRTQRPTVMIAVPRIFERVYARMQEVMPAGSIKRRLFERAVATGWRRWQGRASMTDRLMWPVLHVLVARKLHRRLGGQMRLVVSGAAPFASELAKVFIGLGLTILQGYGLTEFSPVVSANRIDDNEPSSVGTPVEGAEIKIASDGELLVRGPSRMQGYWNNSAATAAVIDAEGWLHTGDLVKTAHGRIYIVGRAKEIIVLSNGEKVPPTDAEQAILMDPAFEQVMVIGEARPALGLIAVTKLTDERQIVERANEQLHAFPGYVRIRYVVRAPEPWTPDNGLLTPTLKLRRQAIEARLQTQIEAAYRGKPVFNQFVA